MPEAIFWEKSLKDTSIDLNRTKNALEVQAILDKNTRERQADDLRNNAASIVFWYVAICTFIVFGIVCLQGFKVFNFILESNIILALVGTLFAQVIGLAIIVIKYLFPALENM